MSDFAFLASTLASLYAETDDGSGAPQRVSGHEADRLATLPRHEHRQPRPRLRPRLTVRLTVRRPADA
ncbi:hypothetical protein F4556_006211 [Kitasatospora gansuensis]|uniref:Uncharacterized protein n=1 Tax=Kitasatospora gansuensis TaxID=258050 RepID=A0A7W7SHP1_9ACTN|nr:hypothetical protein [Kitasatospora gansuensis]MBB4950676.1 hypothetical protein [Kitasatospora gansuensis]